VRVRQRGLRGALHAPPQPLNALPAGMTSPPTCPSNPPWTPQTPSPTHHRHLHCIAPLGPPHNSRGYTSLLHLLAALPPRPRCWLVRRPSSSAYSDAKGSSRESAREGEGQAAVRQTPSPMLPSAARRPDVMPCQDGARPDEVLHRVEAPLERAHVHVRALVAELQGGGRSKK